MAAQGLLGVVERCLEGTEDVANSNDVECAVDDVHHSFDGVVDVHLVHVALLNFDVGLSLDGYLDDLLVLDAVDELQHLVLDQHDVFCLLYDDIYVDDVYVVDVRLVLLNLDDLVVLDDGDLVVDHSVVLSLCCDVDVLDDDYSHSRCRHQSPDAATMVMVSWV